MSQDLKTRLAFAKLIAQLIANGATEDEVEEWVKFALQFDRKEVQAIEGLFESVLAVIRSMIPVFAQNEKLKKEKEALQAQLELSKSTPTQCQRAPPTDDVSAHTMAKQQTFAAATKLRLPSSETLVATTLPTKSWAEQADDAEKSDTSSVEKWTQKKSKRDVKKSLGELVSVLRECVVDLTFRHSNYRCGDCKKFHATHAGAPSIDNSHTKNGNLEKISDSGANTWGHRLRVNIAWLAKCPNMFMNYLTFRCNTEGHASLSAFAWHYDNYDIIFIFQYCAKCLVGKHDMIQDIIREYGVEDSELLVSSIMDHVNVTAHPSH